MFEAVELGQKVSKKASDTEVPELRASLLETQLNLVAANTFAVVVVIGGVNGAGKRELVGTLNSWMDPRAPRLANAGEGLCQAQRRDGV